MQIKIYSKEYCPFCHMAKRLLKNKGMQYETVDIDRDPELRDEMIERSGRRTVPQIFFGDRHIGGFDELNALQLRGELDNLLDAAGSGT